jgi:hypothetical protein
MKNNMIAEAVIIIFCFLGLGMWILDEGFPSLARDNVEFFAFWGGVLCLAGLAIPLFKFTSRIKALTKGNPHIIAAYVFAVILTVLLTILVIKL